MSEAEVTGNRRRRVRRRARQGVGSQELPDGGRPYSVSVSDQRPHESRRQRQQVYLTDDEKPFFDG